MEIECGRGRLLLSSWRRATLQTQRSDGQASMKQRQAQACQVSTHGTDE